MTKIQIDKVTNIESREGAQLAVVRIKGLLEYQEACEFDWNQQRTKTQRQLDEFCLELADALKIQATPAAILQGLDIEARTVTSET